MRICIITKFLPPASTDGIPRNRWEYALQFASLGHEVHIISSGFKGNERFEKGVYIHEIPAWDQEIFSKMFTSTGIDETCRHKLCYSYLVYERIKKLNDLFPIDIIDSPLWDIEGYITKLRIPHIPMVVRLETTTMLLQEILTDKQPNKTDINEAESNFMELADAFVFDSWSILKETERLYSFNFNSKPYSVIHHGIDISGSAEPQIYNSTRSSDKINILIAGRLEKRKGADILVEKVLPSVLSLEKNIIFHIAGKDSAEWDGFLEKNGVSYCDYIKKNFRKYIGKQIFIYGYVSDDQLENLYDSADVVLALSIYESFGLLYLEAMKKCKPLIAFDTGAVPEIFENGKDAILVSKGNPEKITDAILYLKNNPEVRDTIAKNALQKFKTEFSSERMGKKCISFFESIVFSYSDERLLQAMNCLTDRDGVSNTTIGYDILLKKHGINTQIIGDYASDPVKDLSKRIENIQWTEKDYVIYHYWNYCERAEYFNSLIIPKKIFFFHNITHPNFFQKNDEAFSATAKGYEQLSMFDNFDLYVCHSNYSAQILKQAISKPITTLIIPPVIDRQTLVNKKFDGTISLHPKAFNILFVGGIAPHKRQTDLIRFFHHYVTNVNSSASLIIAGGGSEKYVKELKELIVKLDLNQSQVRLMGKISDSQLYSIYRSADVFLSMSEHEGFGVPLAEAMTFDIPVVAYNSTGVPETVGDNGCLFDRKDYDLISCIIEKLRNDDFRQEVISKQREYLKRFSPEAIFKLFQEMKVAASKQYKYRIAAKLKEGPLLIDEVFLYNHQRLILSGKTKVVDGNLLLIDSSDVESLIAIRDDFSDFEVRFLTHPWSGKVILCLDNEREEEFDLYSYTRKIKTFKLENIAPGMHELIIKPSGNKNQNSKGSEVLFERLILKKPFRKGNEKKEVYQEHPGTMEILSPGEDLADFFGETEDENNNGRYLLEQEVIAGMHPALRYEGEWFIKDQVFHYANGKQICAVSYRGEFSYLDIVFLTHDWSGKVLVRVDNYTEVLNLYNPKSAEKTFRIGKIFPFREHKVVIKPIGEKDMRSKGLEVFFKNLILTQRKHVDISDETLERDYKVSVIINTLNRASHVKALLKDLEQQTYPYFEIVVVNGPSNDNTKEVLEKYKNRIKIISCPEANLSMSRNIGIEHSAGNYVAFIDDDALPSDERWLENFVLFIVCHSDKNIGAIGGPVKHRNTQHYEFKNGATSDYGMQIFREEELKTHVLDGKRWVQGVPGGNNITSKEALYDIGGFDERFIYYLDETDMCIRLARKGYFIANNPASYIRHFKAPSNVRKSTFEIRWDIIARSDTFYGLKNGFDGLLVRFIKVMSRFKKKHFFVEVQNAYKENKITLSDYKRYRRMLRKGFWQGIRWAAKQPRNINYLKNKSSVFVEFAREKLAEPNSL
jgi:glycosyltransferase involved in cell wall biosynthesis